MVRSDKNGSMASHDVDRIMKSSCPLKSAKMTAKDPTLSDSCLSTWASTHSKGEISSYKGQRHDSSKGEPDHSNQTRSGNCRRTMVSAIYGCGSRNTILGLSIPMEDSGKTVSKGHLFNGSISEHPFFDLLYLSQQQAPNRLAHLKTLMTLNPLSAI